MRDVKIRWNGDRSGLSVVGDSIIASFTSDHGTETQSVEIPLDILIALLAGAGIALCPTPPT